ncbi:Stf0 family sulfotransferase [Mesorhizobium australicum]|uniref:Stf0 family sulfotransferase n=1 Tax=Mesorhizobium australicum TaxID=536018 RepID=UPI00333C5142
MRGVAILTEGRSGSNWLGSLTNATGLMGRSEEWLDPAYLRFKPRSYDALEKAVIAKGSTDNGRFAIKLFPRHLIWCRETFGMDILFQIRSIHGLQFIVLERRDRIQQAISFYRARMSGVWTSRHEGKVKPRAVHYNFADISQAYFQIDRSYAFWKSYLQLSGLDFRHFVYEDLQQDPKPYLKAMADFMGVQVPEDVAKSKFTIQRDNVTEAWMVRFREDAAAKGAIEGIREMAVPRTLDNLARFALKRPLVRKRF